jgi:hypothetical protein
LVRLVNVCQDANLQFRCPDRKAMLLATSAQELCSACL